MNKWFLTVFMVISAANGYAAERVDAKQVDDWMVEKFEDDWGENSKILITGPGKITISIDPKFGFIFVNFAFKDISNTWPNCDVTNITYKIDDGKPVKTGLGGTAHNRFVCVKIGMPKYMLDDFKSGKVLEIRAGVGHRETKRVSLKGFDQIWSYAESLADVGLKIEDWSTPRK